MIGGLVFLAAAAGVGVLVVAALRRFATERSRAEQQSRRQPGGEPRGARERQREAYTRRQQEAQQGWRVTVGQLQQAELAEQAVREYLARHL